MDCRAMQTWSRQPKMIQIDQKISDEKKKLKKS
jgi:hypothetical protein